MFGSMDTIEAMEHMLMAIIDQALMVIHIIIGVIRATLILILVKQLEEILQVILEIIMATLQVRHTQAHPIVVLGIVVVH